MPATAAATPLPLAALRPLGRGVVRPECVLAHSSGLIVVPDWSERGGVAPPPTNFVLRDEAGRLWITSPVSNRIVRLAPDGVAATVLDDADPVHVDAVESAYLAGAMGRPHLDEVTGTVLHGLSSLAFGGRDLPSHWRHDVAALPRLLGDAA